MSVNHLFPPQAKLPITAYNLHDLTASHAVQYRKKHALPLHGTGRLQITGCNIHHHKKKMVYTLVGLLENNHDISTKTEMREISDVVGIA
jgi:hypothetical protein